MAVKRYLTEGDSRTQDPLTPLCAVMLFASPRAGTPWALPVLRNLIPEGKWLSRKSSHLEAIDQFFI